LGGRINPFEGPSLVEVFAQVPKESHTIAISARIALLFHFTICLLSISAPFIPPLNKVGFVWLKHRLARRVNMGPFWRLLHTQILVDALPTHTYLASDSGWINPLGMQFMDLLVACDALLMELEAFCFQMLPHAGLKGEPVALPPPRRGLREAFELGL